MLDQGYGAVYNMEGMGSNGRIQEGMTICGTSKATVHEALVSETESTPVLVGSISPGMMVTDLVIDQFKEDPDMWQRSKRVLSIIMDEVGTVPPWLAPRILLNEKHGARIAWLTRRRLPGRFLLAPFLCRPALGELEDYQ
jgi:short-subunit dehydrogenase